MADLITPSKWDIEYYPTATDIVYEVLPNVKSILDMKSVIMKSKFPIEETHKYLIQGLPPEVSPTTYRLEFRLTTQPKFGDVVFMGDHLVYTPRPGYLGRDTFRYQLLLGQRSSNLATAEIYVGIQAKYPTCTTTTDPFTQIVEFGSGLIQPIYLCKPTYSLLNFKIPIRLYNYIGSFGEPSEDEEGNPIPPDNSRILKVQLLDLKTNNRVVTEQEITINAEEAVLGVDLEVIVATDETRLRNVGISVYIVSEEMTSIAVNIGSYNIKLTQDL